MKSQNFTAPRHPKARRKTRSHPCRTTNDGFRGVFYAPFFLEMALKYGNWSIRHAFCPATGGVALRLRIEVKGTGF